MGCKKILEHPCSVETHFFLDECLPNYWVRAEARQLAKYQSPSLPRCVGSGTTARSRGRGPRHISFLPRSRTSLLREAEWLRSSASDLHRALRACSELWASLISKGLPQ
jgi:hypothetical protein